MNEFVAVFFRLLNFAILIVGSFYLFKKYALKSIEKKIEDQILAVESLHQQRASLEQELVQVESTKQKHSQEYQLLGQRIEQWRAVFVQEEYGHIQEKKTLIAALEKRRELQNKYRTLLAVERAIMNELFAKATSQLQQEFTTSKKIAYLEQIKKDIKSVA